MFDGRQVGRSDGEKIGFYILSCDLLYPVKNAHTESVPAPDCIVWGIKEKVDGVTCHNGVDGGDGLISDVLVPDQDKRLPKEILSILS